MHYDVTTQVTVERQGERLHSLFITTSVLENQSRQEHWVKTPHQVKFFSMCNICHVVTTLYIFLYFVAYPSPWHIVLIV